MPVMVHSIHNNIVLHIGTLEHIGTLVHLCMANKLAVWGEGRKAT